MDINLSGRFEIALIREVTAQGQSREVLSKQKGPYYDDLFRFTDKSYFDRCATFIAIAASIRIGNVDWRADQFNKLITFKETNLGLTRTDIDEKKRLDIKCFAALLLRLHAFSERTLQVLTTVTGPSGQPIIYPPIEVDLIGKVDWFAWSHLTRLLNQVCASTSSSAWLVLSDEERTILGEVCDFLVKTGLPSPIPLPDLKDPSAIDGNKFAGGLLNFSPPDAASVVAVRSDPSIAKYAAKVREAIGTPSSLDTQRALVLAMREALTSYETAQRADSVFEVVSWIAKPLHYIPGLDAILSIGEDALDLVRKWADRKKSSDEWFLLGAKMTCIATIDYLKRTDNL